MLATALKSLSCRETLLLKAPWRRSTAIFLWVVKGSVPTTPNFLILSTALVTVASRGKLLGQKLRMARNCLFVALSPRLKEPLLASNVPPRLLVSDDSNIQPSNVPVDCTTSGLGGGGSVDAVHGPDWFRKYVQKPKLNA